MTTALATVKPLAADIENLLVAGDLQRLSPEQRVGYYKALCESVGLNPLTQPFEYIVLNGKLRLYARKDCTDQLRQLHGVSIAIAARELVEGIYVVTAKATDRSGRSDEAIGAVPLDKLQGEARANAMMKAETKAKRRVTLSVCGLGMLDENEVDGIPGVQRETAPPKWTAGTENAPPREQIRGFEDPSEVDTVGQEYTEPVSVYDPDTGEEVRKEPGLTSAQNKKIHALLRDVRNQYADDRYRKDLRRSFSKDHTNQLSIREAGKVIESLEKRRARLEPLLKDQEDAHLAAREREAAARNRQPGDDDVPPEAA